MNTSEMRAFTQSVMVLTAANERDTETDLSLWEDERCAG